MAGPVRLFEVCEEIMLLAVKSMSLGELVQAESDVIDAEVAYTLQCGRWLRYTPNMVMVSTDTGRPVIDIIQEEIRIRQLS